MRILVSISLIIAVLLVTAQFRPKKTFTRTSASESPSTTLTESTIPASSEVSTPALPTSERVKPQSRRDRLDWIREIRVRIDNATTPESLQAVLSDIHSKTPTDRDLRPGYEKSIKRPPTELTDFGMIIGSLQRKADGDSQFVDTIGNYYHRCAHDDSVATLLRSLCLSRALRLDPSESQSWSQSSHLDSEIVRMAHQLNKR